MRSWSDSGVSPWPGSTASSALKGVRQYSDSATDDSKPFNPKRITYEVYGPPGTTADISYFDTNADPQHVDGAKLPWTLNMTTKAASVVGNVVAQGNSNTLGLPHHHR